jgi:ribosomal protein L37AE/L43A
MSEELLKQIAEYQELNSELFKIIQKQQEIYNDYKKDTQATYDKLLADIEKLEAVLNGTVDEVNNELLAASAEEPEIEVCSGCLNEVRRMGEDGISFCDHCEAVVEGLGMTRKITQSEFEEAHA